MGILRSDRVSGLGGANATNGSVFFPNPYGSNYFHPYMEIVSDDFVIGAGDFTSECFFYQDGAGGHTSTGGNILVLTANRSGTNGIWLGHRNDGKFQANIHYSGGTWNLQITSTNAFNTNQWYHVALVRSGSAVKLYVDGVQEASGTSSSALTASVSNAAWIGAQGNSTNPSTVGARGINGYISNVRISNEALYTAAFTPPTTRLEKLSSTLLLCCQSPGNILKEETGKTITLYKKVTASTTLGAKRFAPDLGEEHGTTFTDNTKFDTLSYMVPAGGTTAESNRGRAVFAGGETPSKVNSIEYINIQSMGTAKDFGDLTITSGDVKGLGSSTRGVFRLDNNPSSRNVLEYITFATTSNAADFGDLVIAVQQRSGASNQTRGIFAGGLYPGSTTYNDMDYITIASTGNAADFGNLSVSRADTSALASPTRMVVAGGWTPGPTYSDVVDYVTIATTGDAADFGDLNTGKRGGTAVANSTRGVFGPGRESSVSNVLDYITIATTGTVTDFGDALLARGGAGSASNSIRGLFAGGYTPTIINGIEFINIATTGNGADFGDMTFVSQYGGGCSDSHGGIS